MKSHKKRINFVFLNFHMFNVIFPDSIQCFILFREKYTLKLTI